MICFTGCWRFLESTVDNEQRLEASEKEPSRSEAPVLTFSSSPPTLLHQLGQCSERVEKPTQRKISASAACQGGGAAPFSVQTPPQLASPTKRGSKARHIARSWKQKAIDVVERWPGVVQEAGALAERCATMLHMSPTLPGSPRSRAYNMRRFIADGRAGGCIVNGTIVEQPKDGSCLFHSIAYGLGDKTCSVELRRDIAAFIAGHPSDKIANTTIQDWVKMVTGEDHYAYAEALADRNTWGGDLELAVATRIMDVNINVFEPQEVEGQFRCIASFGRPFRSGRGSTVSVVFHPERHYDALLLDGPRTT